MSLVKDTAVTGVRRNKQGIVIAFNINRKNWGRGERGGGLLDVVNVYDENQRLVMGRKQINMCCLGIYGRACGVGVKRLQGKGMPLDIPERPKQMDWTVKTSYYGTDNSALANRLAKINDSTRTKDAQKEVRIIKEFGKVGIKVRFVGKG